jgi:hypothetical protein
VEIDNEWRKTQDVSIKTRHAGCSCGKLSLSTQGEPFRISICHCLACQRRTGSVFGAQARFNSDRVEIEGPSREYLRTADSGNRISFHFCPDCGSTVYYRIESDPGVIAVPVGNFADPEFPQPFVSVYESRRHEWVDLPTSIERMD